MIMPTAYCSPPLSRYNASLDLFDMVYEEDSDLVFTLVVIDQGNPVRGDSASVRLTLSNTCFLDNLLQELEINLSMDEDEGNMTLRIPKYYHYHFGMLCLITQIFENIRSQTRYHF